MNKKLHILALLISITFFSCGNKTKDNLTDLNTDSQIQIKENMTDQKEIFKNKVIVFLTKEPELNSNIIEVQDFIENGQSSVPVFTSIEKLKESTQGAELPYPKYEFEGLFLLSLMEGNEVIRINPSLSDEAFFKASDLKEYYKTDIDELLKNMESKQ